MVTLNYTNNESDHVGIPDAVSHLPIKTVHGRLKITVERKRAAPFVWLLE